MVYDSGHECNSRTNVVILSTSLRRLEEDEAARLTDAKPATMYRQGLKWKV